MSALHDAAFLWYALWARSELKDRSEVDLRGIAEGCLETAQLNPLYFDEKQQGKLHVSSEFSNLSPLQVLALLTTAIDLLTDGDYHRQRYETQGEVFGKEICLARLFDDILKGEEGNES